MVVVEVAGVQPAAPLLLFARTLLFYECTQAIPGWEWRHSIRFVVDQDSLAKQYIEICNSYLDAELNLLSRDYINFNSHKMISLLGVGAGFFLPMVT